MNLLVVVLVRKSSNIKILALARECPKLFVRILKSVKGRKVAIFR